MMILLPRHYYHTCFLCFLVFLGLRKESVYNQGFQKHIIILTLFLISIEQILKCEVELLHGIISVFKGFHVPVTVLFIQLSLDAELDFLCNLINR